ncbi:MAG: DUF2339 domain-containing protein [Halopseudomonas sp.]
MQLKDELRQLRAELKALRAEQGQQQQRFANRLAIFSDRLDGLTRVAEQQAPSDDLGGLPTESIVQSDSIEPAKPTEPTSPIISTGLRSESSSEPSSIHEPKAYNDPWGAPAPTEQLIRASKDTAKAQISNQFIQNAGQVSASLGEFSAAFLGPVAGIKNQIQSFYQHYQDKGLGPVFLMTIAGIITLTLGFGYLLQYSVNNWFSELGKALLGFGSANAIVAGGLFIWKKRSGMADFGSALVGLGLILNYLSTYFIGPYFELIPTSFSFILLLLISLSGFWLSMKFNAKIVSIIALVGGSLAPMMLISGSQVPLLYLPYLLLIGSCSLWQSRRLNWPLLMEMATLLHIACIEAFVLYLGQPLQGLDWPVIAALVSVNTIFYVYGLSGLTWLSKQPMEAFTNNDELSSEIGIHKPITKRMLAMPIALVAFMLLVISQLTPYSGEIFLANGVVCAGLYRFFRGHQQIRALMLLFAGSFIGFAALNLISHDFLGLVLLLEGLLLLWLGCKEHFISVRAESYVLLAVGIGFNIVGLSTVFDHGHLAIADINGYAFPLVTLTLTAAALFVATVLMAPLFVCKEEAGDERSSKQGDRQHFSAEHKVWVLFKELLSVNYSACLLFVAYLISHEYFLNSLPLISVMLLHLAAKGRLKFTELFAWLLLLPLLGMVALGVMDSGSFSFTDQPLYANLARVELFLSLLLSYYWYKRHYSSSRIIKAVYWLQIACYLALPLIFLPKVIRNFEAYTSIALWLSCFISIGLARFVKHRALIIEAQLLTVVATVITAMACLAEQWQGLIALAIGAGFMLSLLYGYPRLDRLWRLMLKRQWHLSPFYLSLVIAVIVQTLVSFWHPSWGIVAAGLSGYFAILLSRAPVPNALRPGYSVAYVLLFACSVVPLLMHAGTGAGIALRIDILLLNVAEIASLVILGKLILAKGLAIRFHKRHLPLNALHWGWHLLLGLSYLLWSYQFPSDIAQPLSAILMVTHGCWLMFISLRPGLAHIIKLAAGLFALTCIKVIFVDMASFDLIQKIIAFMLIGAILLTVSYFYQQARNRQIASATAGNASSP